MLVQLRHPYTSGSLVFPPPTLTTISDGSQKDGEKDGEYRDMKHIQAGLWEKKITIPDVDCGAKK